MATNTELHVIFGTGALGLATMKELTAQGKQVRMVNRRGQAEVPAGVDVVKADVNDRSSTDAATQGASVVYNCTNPPYHQWTELLTPLFMGIAESAARAKAKLVVGDNLYMYGKVTGPMREDTPYTAHTRKGQLRAQVAEKLMAMHRAGDVQVAIGRASDYFGPFGRIQSTFGDRFITPLLTGKSVTTIGNLDMPHTYSYISDFGKGLAILGTHDVAFGQIWHTPNAPTVTSREFINLFFEEAGMTPKIFSAPGVLIKAMGLVNPFMHELDEMLYEFTAPFVVDHSKFERAFGNIATPHRQAVRETLAWFRANPLPSKAVKNAPVASHV